MSMAAVAELRRSDKARSIDPALARPIINACRLTRCLAGAAMPFAYQMHYARYVDPKRAQPRP